MTNIWIERSKNRKYSLEIAKNAIFRFGPIPVRIIEKNINNKTLLLNLGDANKIDIVELSNIMDEIEFKDLSYYGRIRSFVSKKESKTIEMKSITKLEINFDHKDLLLTVNYS